VPGESSLAVLDALHDTPDIDTIVCRQEGRVAYMADADRKMTGRPGIAFVTRGPGGFAFAENGRRGNLIGDLVESGKEGPESYQIVKAIHQT
jgi:hypothetical protein